MAAFLVAGMAQAATYRQHIARNPAAPHPTNTVRVWINSDTALGETVVLEYRIGASYTKVAGTYDNATVPGANWYADIPAQAAGTAVDYQIISRNQSSVEYAWTGFNWGYTVADTDYAVGYTQLWSQALASNRAGFTNRNPGSPYYGYLYLLSGTTIQIYQPNPPAQGNGASAYTNTNKTITTASGAYDVYVGEDDNLWICTTNAVVQTAPPVPSGSSVAAVTQIDLPGTGRAVCAVGSIEDADVFITSNTSPQGLYKVTLQIPSGNPLEVPSTVITTPDWTYTYPVSPNPGYFPNAGPYGVAADSAGNSYIAVPAGAGAGANLITKFDPSGTRISEATWKAARPSWTTLANSLADVQIVEDSALPGGGYLYHCSRVQPGGTTDHKLIVHRFRLDNGAWLDSFGPAGDVAGYTPSTAPAGTFTTLSLTNSTSVYLMGADDVGNLYVTTDAFATVRKIARTPDNVTTGAAVKSSPTQYQGVTYFGSDDGILRAIGTSDGNTVWTYDAKTVAGSGAKIVGRPAIRMVPGAYDPVPRLFFTTDNGYLFMMGLNGSPAATPIVLTGATSVSTAPAVDADIFVAGTAGTVARLWKVPLNLSGQTMVDLPGASVASSPSVFGNSVYVGTLGTGGSTCRVQATDLSVQTAVAMEPTASSPFVASTSTIPILYTATTGGKVYALNASTFAAKSDFGTAGVQTLTGSPTVQSDIFAYNGKLYIGGMDNKVYCLNAGNGAGGGPAGSMVFFDAGATGSIPGGLAVNPIGRTSLVFGNSNGRLYNVKLSDPSEFSSTWVSSSALTTAPTIDTANNSVLIGCDDGKLYRVPRF